MIMRMNSGKRLKIIDLTHPISENMPMYQGTGTPKLNVVHNYKESGFMETLISMYSHTGTHIDAPAHLYANGFTLDKYPVEQFVGKAVVVDCRNLNEGEKISIQLLEKKGNIINETDFILFLTGHSQLWGNHEYFNRCFPVMSHEAVEWINQRKLKGVGIDAPSFDTVTSENSENIGDELQNHRAILKTNQTLLLENLCKLEETGDELFTLCAMPLNTVNADGAPARVIALIC